MLRIILTCCCCLAAIVVAITVARTADAAQLSPLAVPVEQTTPSARGPVAIDDAKDWWRQQRRDSEAADYTNNAEHADQALAALRELEALYRREAALWAYHDALQQGSQTAAELRRRRADYRAAMADERRDLDHLNQRLAQLRRAATAHHP